MNKDRDVELKVNLKIGEKQMQLLRALAFFEGFDTFENYIWDCIVSGVQADLSGYEGDVYDKGLKIIEGEYR